MAEKKEMQECDSHERLKIWIGLAKVVAISFFASVTLIEMTKQDSRTKIKVAQIEAGLEAGPDAAKGVKK